MEDNSTNIWILRREEEKRIGHPIRIFSAYPLIGRGTIAHNMLSHEEVEKKLERALSFSFRQIVIFLLRSLMRKSYLVQLHKHN